MSIINKLVLRNYQKGLREVELAKRNGQIKPDVAKRLIESLKMSMKGAKEQVKNESKQNSKSDTETNNQSK